MADSSTGSTSGPSSDSDLLARLNALRPTSVSLDTGPHLSVSSAQKAPDTDTLLSDRLRALRNVRSSSDSRSKPFSSAESPSTDQLTSAILSDARKQTESAVSNLETPIVDIDDRADRQLARDALDFVRASAHDVPKARPAGGSSQPRSTMPTPEEVIRRLRDDAVGGLSRSDDLLKSTSGSSLPKKTDSGKDSKSDEASVDEPDAEGAESDDDEDRDLDEEAREAEEALARLLDEADLEEREEAENKPHPQPPNETSNQQASPPPSNSPLILPATSSDLPSPPDPPDPETLAFTTSIAARMAALQPPATDPLGMPSAPTTRPVSPPRTTFQSQPVPEPPTCCVICYDTATVLCRGCEDNFGDAEEALYCARCWREGHLGADAGVEERAHEWIKFKRPT